MADNTGIEWTDATWNPTTGCDRVSPGCDHCYAMTLAPRLKAMGSAKYQTDGDPRTSGPGFGLAMHPSALDQPLRWQGSRRIFVNSMSDLFHDQVTDDFIARVFVVMALAPQHTFQILTKRHGRMRSLVDSLRFRILCDTIEYEAAQGLIDGIPADLAHRAREARRGPDGGIPPRWPLPNVWLGVSVEDQRWADIRIPALLNTPAAVRFLSMEPLLGRVTFRWAKWHPWVNSGHLDGLKGIDWVIVGGESGLGARPMHADWVRDLRDQSTEARVAFFFKQWGSHGADGTPMPKKDAGRQLDGRSWDEFPAGVA